MNVMWSQISSHSTVYLTAHADPHPRNVKDHITDPLCGEFTGDRWIPGIKDQECGISFHFDDVIMIWPVALVTNLASGDI